MNHYLRSDLVKSEVPIGESKDGKYAARLQIGVEKDGSPMYKYFKTREEYETYLKNRAQGNKSEKGSKLKQKVDKEHAASTYKVKQATSVGKKNLFTGKDKDKDKDKDDKKKDVKKSLGLFVRG